MNSNKKLFVNFDWIVLCFFLYCVLVKKTEANASQCLPEDPETCQYGGQCTSITTFYHELGSFTEFLPNEYRCRCKINFDCYAEGFHPVCGDDGKTHYNDVCRRVEECTEQKEINVRCNSMCSECQENTEPERRRCISPWKNNHCFNFGECLMTQSGLPYCRCRTGFFGERCDSYSPTGRIPSVQELSYGTTG